MKKLKKERKSKKKKRKRSRSKLRSPSPPPKQVILPPGAPSMEELRRRKAQREAKARQKTQAVMDRINGVVAKTEPIVEEEADERKRTYNNAFNPALNRKSKKYDY